MICPICGMAVRQHSEGQARWCYRRYLERAADDDDPEPSLAWRWTT